MPLRQAAPAWVGGLLLEVENRLDGVAAGEQRVLIVEDLTDAQAELRGLVGLGAALDLARSNAGSIGDSESTGM